MGSIRLHPYTISWRICYILALVSYVRTYSTGATTESCVSLGIDHTQGDGSIITPQSFQSWYRITFVNDEDYYQTDSTVRVVIEAINGTTFTGFILQARRSNTTSPVGQWREVLPANTRMISCGSENDTVTHSSSGIAMRRLELEWTPTQSYGQIEFWASISANYFVFWNNLRSRTLIHVIPSTVSLRSNATIFQEDAGQFPIFICAEPSPSSDIEVALVVIPLSGVESSLSVPEIAVIPAGTDCIERNVTLEDDFLAEEDVIYLISFNTVSAPNLIGAPISVTIVDNDMIIPSVVSLRSADSSLPEDAGQFPIFVCAEPPPSSDVEVVLQIVPLSSVDHDLSVPERVVITNGTNCVDTNVGFDDDLTPAEDGMYLIVISSVTPPNLRNGSIHITIEDNDDACSRSPCANDGTCFISGDSFGCQCAYGYTGENCTEEEMFLSVSLNPRTLTLTEGSDGNITVCYTGGPNVSIISISVNFDTASSRDIQLSNLTLRVTDTEPCAILMIRAVDDNLVEEIEDFSLEVIAVSTNTSLRLDEREVSTVVLIMDIVIFPCDSNPCQNQGQCTNVDDDSFECLCTEEWDGPTCNRRIVIPCSSSPCSNGATCTNIGEVDFDCTCPDGFVGRDCSLPNPCLNNQEICNNAGDCSVNGDGTARCDCMEGFHGNNCEISLECLLNPCHNDGTCISTLGISRRCECPPRFFGENCELNDLCYGSPCMNGGTCESLPNNYRCICSTGFTGTLCDILMAAPRPCAFNPCRNQGVCEAIDGMAVCRCLVGWDGPTCEQRVPLEVDCPPEIEDYCQNGGRCLSSTIDPSSLRCVCPSQYTGTQCENRLLPAVTVEPNNPCEPNPCRNNGRCFPLSLNRVTCTCALDFLTGEFCDVCVTNHCFNGGTCRNVDGERGCECPAGVTGNLCERVEACKDFECNNGGFCIVANGRPVCQCPDGFVGNKCNEADPCNGISCFNGGRCVDGSCLCTVAFAGDFCEIESQPQDSSASSGFLVSYGCIATFVMVVINNFM